MTETTTPTLEAWRRLYALMAAVKEMEPWEWMYETDVFAVQDPDDGTLYFVSVMGNLGEHLSIAVYLGTRAFYRLLDFAATPDSDATGEELLEISHLQASFEDREQLTSQDRDVIKQLGLKFRGRMAWPLFRSYRAGFAPWMLEADEVRIMTMALEQLLDIAPRFGDEEIDFPDEKEGYLVRVQEDGAWHERVMAPPHPEPESIHIDIPKSDAEALRRLRRSRNIFEVDLFLMPGAIGNRRSRPQMAYILMVVDKQSGAILSGEPLHVETTFQEMLAEVPKRFVQMCLNMQGIPGEIHVTSERVEWLLSSLSSLMDSRIKRVRRLPALNNARNAMLQFLMH